MVCRIDAYFDNFGFKKSSSESILYTKRKEGAKTLIVSIYVDDIIYTGSCMELMEEFKSNMMNKYEMVDLDSCIILWDESYENRIKHFDSLEEVCHLTNQEVWIVGLQTC